MNLDEDEYAREIKLNAYGQVDAEYYYAKARQMRADCTVEMYRYVINASKSFLQAAYTRLVGLNSQPSH